MTRTITTLLIALLMTACYEASMWEELGGATADEDRDTDTASDTWIGVPSQAPDQPTQSGPGLCAMRCDFSTECPGGQWCCGGSISVCLGDQLLPETDTTACPLGSGWPCTCTDVGAPCADGSVCLEAPTANEVIGVCRPTCATADDCPTWTNDNAVECILPD